MKSIVLLSAALLVVVAFSSLTTADHSGDERSATFVGSSVVDHGLNDECADALNERECPTRIPAGLAFVACDGEENPWSGGLYDGIGAVKFCDVPHGAFVHLEFGEFVSQLGVYGSVYCAYSIREYPNPELGRITHEESLQVRVPYWCDLTGDEEHPEVAEIIVFIHSASLADPALYLPVEGEVNLRIL